MSRTLRVGDAWAMAIQTSIKQGWCRTFNGDCLFILLNLIPCRSIGIEYITYLYSFNVLIPFKWNKMYNDGTSSCQRCVSLRWDTMPCHEFLRWQIIYIIIYNCLFVFIILLNILSCYCFISLYFNNGEISYLNIHGTSLNGMGRCEMKH